MRSQTLCSSRPGVRLLAYGVAGWAVDSLFVAAQERLVESPLLRAFLTDVQGIVARGLTPADACELLRPCFAELLAADGWLPERFQEAAPESGMGGGIGQWLLYRAGDASLSL